MKKVITFALMAFAFCAMADGSVQTGYAQLDDISGATSVVVDAWGAVSNNVNTVLADKAWITVSNDVVNAIKKKSWGAVYHSMTNWVTQEFDAKITAKDAWLEVSNNVYSAISQRAWSAVSDNIIVTLQNMFDAQFGGAEGVSKEYVSAVIATTYSNLFRQLWDTFYGLDYDYYVDGVNGNDNKAGTSPQIPFKTIDRAIGAIEEAYASNTLSVAEVEAKKICVMAGEYSYPTNGCYEYATIPYNLFAIQGSEKTKICPKSTDTNGHYGIHGVNEDGAFQRWHYIKGFTIEGYNRAGCRWSLSRGFSSICMASFEDCVFTTDNRGESAGWSYYRYPFANVYMKNCKVINGKYKCDLASYSNGGFALSFATTFVGCLVDNNYFVNTKTENNAMLFHNCDFYDTTYIDTNTWAMLYRNLSANSAEAENTRFFVSKITKSTSYNNNLYRKMLFRNCVFGIGDSGFVPMTPSWFETENVYNGGFSDTMARYTAGETSADYIPLFGKVKPSETAVRNWVLNQGFKSASDSSLQDGNYLISADPNTGKLMIFNTAQTASLSAKRTVAAMPLKSSASDADVQRNIRKIVNTYAEPKFSDIPDFGPFTVRVVPEVFQDYEEE